MGAHIPDDIETQLMLRFVQGDENAFKELYKLVQMPVYRYTLRMLRRPQMAEEAAQEILDEYASGASMRKLVRPQDVANMAVFLASDKAALVSGQVIAVDGHTENPEPRA